MKNKLSDLNDHLFAEVERLSDEDLKGEALVGEIGRSKAITSVAGQIILAGKLALDAHIAVNQNLLKNVPEVLGAPAYEE